MGGAEPAVTDCAAGFLFQINIAPSGSCAHPLKPKKDKHHLHSVPQPAVLGRAWHTRTLWAFPGTVPRYCREGAKWWQNNTPAKSLNEIPTQKPYLRGRDRRRERGTVWCTVRNWTGSLNNVCKIFFQDKGFSVAFVIWNNFPKLDCDLLSPDFCIAFQFIYENLYRKPVISLVLSFDFPTQHNSV